MSTVIFKWNPSFSSFSMFEFLHGIVEGNMHHTTPGLDWSVWDYEHVKKGDRFYFVKLGPNGTGIVGRGIVIGNPRSGEDWTGKGRTTYYADLAPEIFINPDALPIITTSMLESRIPEFEWDHGHSGEILPPEIAEKLDALWDTYIEQHGDLLRDKATSRVRYNDKIYWQNNHK